MYQLTRVPMISDCSSTVKWKSRQGVPSDPPGLAVKPRSSNISGLSTKA